MRLARQFLVYGVGGAASRLAAIFLVPLYTRTLSVQDYGRLEVLLALQALAVLLIGLQSESAVARDFHEAQAAGANRSLAWGGLLITAIGAGLLPLLALPVAWAGLLPDGVPDYLPWLFAMSIPAQILGIQLILLRFAGSAILFAILSFLDLALSAAISAILIAGFGLGIEGALAGILIAKTVCVAVAWPLSFGRPRGGRPSAATVRQMLAYALPTMPSVLLNWLQTNGSRVVLGMVLTLRDVAVAGVAIKVAALYGFVVLSFRLAWEPHSFERLPGHADNPDFYRRAFEWYALGMFALAGATTAISPLVVAVLAPPAYAEAARLTGLFVVGQFWAGSVTILAIGIHGARITSRLSWIYAVGAALNVAALVALAPLVGVAAAGTGFLAGAVASAWLAARYSDRHFGTGFGRRLLAVSTAASAVLAGVPLLLDRVPGAGRTPLAMLAILSTALVMVVLVAALGIGAGRLPALHRDLRRATRLKARRT